jgi:glycosyltransferase involved in cell wall biosynthesis
MSEVRRRISLFMESLGGGGAERVMLNLARKFAQWGHQTDLVVASAKGPHRSQVPDSVRLVDLGTTRTITAILPLASYLRRESPDALLSKMGHCNIVSLLARKLARSETRVVVGEVSLMGISTKTAPQSRSRLIPFLAKRLYPRADAIIAVSRGVAADLARVLDLAADRISVIYDPVVTPELHERASRMVVHPWFATGARPVIIGVGRLDPEKDFPTLLRAFSMVRRNRNVRLMILGEGPERFVLESLAQELGITDVLALPGFVENPLPFIANASVLALTSRFEGLPNVVIEALACGTPVVATDCPGGTTEILGGGHYGKLAPVGDSEEVARAIQETLENPPDPMFLKGAAERFSVDAIARKYLEVLVG